MKKLIICTAALALFTAAPALSASNNQHGDKHQGATQGSTSHAAFGGTHQNAPGGAMTSGTHTRTGGTHQNTMATKTSGSRYLPASGDTYRSKTAHSVTSATHTRTGGANTHSAMSGNTFGAGTPTNTNSGGNGMHRTNSGSGNSGMFANSSKHHPSINLMRLNVQASHQFHNGNYNAPRGYQSRHWSYGDRLPRLYYARDYWIADFLMFGLFAPPDGLVWVRVGDDALLIDEYSGDIVQVDYGVFY